MSSPDVALDGPAQAAPHPAARATTAGRLLFVDNIRVFLTVLVMLHHLAIIYVGGGSWIYTEGRQDEILAALGGWFTAVNQAYFMGLFLLISAYFVPGSYDRKGPAGFLKDRLIRLGVPLVVYGWLIRPLMIYLAFSAAGSIVLPFVPWYTAAYFRDYGIIGGGPLWFIEVLLIFSAVYVLWRLGAKALTRSRPAPILQAATRPSPFPSILAIAACALLLGTATFLVRVRFPVGSSFKPLNLQLANFVQYITLFILGLIAYRRSWLTALPKSTGRFWLGASIALIVLYPALAVLAGATENQAPFMGGWHWQSLLYALWESFVCLGMCTGLLYLFRSRWNGQGKVAPSMARHAYAAYLIHEPVISLLAFAWSGVVIYPLLKFGVASLIFIPITFGLSILLLKIPKVDRVL